MQRSVHDIEVIYAGRGQIGAVRQKLGIDYSASMQSHLDCRAAVQRIWREADLKPHLKQKFKVSNDPQFEVDLPRISGKLIAPAGWWHGTLARRLRGWFSRGSNAACAGYGSLRCIHQWLW